jgi:dGTPase
MLFDTSILNLSLSRIFSRMTASSNSLSWDRLLNDTRSKELLPDLVEEEKLPEKCREEEGNYSDDKEDGFDEHRSEFDRDYDRTLFSPPVRRLQDKAQVFPLDPSDIVRTRGTHSMEVANLAKSFVNRLRPFFEEEKGLEVRQIRQIRSIAETCGILHDLGNPPYGHAGETAMQNWFEKTFAKYVVDRPPQRVYSVLDSQIHTDGLISLGEYLEDFEGNDLAADFRNFDGNAQTIRLVTKLQMLADFNGLNLTAGTLAAALKYTARADQTDEAVHAREKPGFFSSEQKIVKEVRNETGLGQIRHPIAYIVEACDDMVYSAVDLEDGIKKQVITWEDISGAFDDDSTGARLVAQAKENADCRIAEAGPYGEKLSRQGADEAKALLFRTYAISEHLAAAVESFKDHYEEIMQGTYGKKDDVNGELLKDGDTRDLRKTCKNLGQEEVYTSSEIVTREAKGRQIIADLMGFFWEGARHTHWDKSESGEADDNGGVEVEGEFAEKAYDLMSENYKLVFERDMSPERVETTGIPREYRQLQLVADYVSGMTDGFAQSLHKDLFNG